MNTNILPRMFSEIGENDIIMLLIDTIPDLAREMGKKLSDDDVTYISGKLKFTLKNKYRNWRIADYMHCLECGKIGQYNGVGLSSALTVSTIETWLFKHAPKVQAQIIADQLTEQSKRINATSTAFTENRNPQMAEAVLWRISAITSLSERNSKKGIQSAEYIQRKKEIENIPFQTIVDAVKSGTTNKLLQ